ncbi:MAG: hypothetical protein NT075_22975 [Chloroflexi bacterium]|nr:hypothetical protein [Chloroflexota bacterium]
MGIPYERWQPLSVAAVMQVLQGAPFFWCLAGGYVIEQFLGKSLRPHGDIDIVVFRDDQRQAQSWLQDWVLYAADPPGVLRKWASGEILPEGSMISGGIKQLWMPGSCRSCWPKQKAPTGLAAEIPPFAARKLILSGITRASLACASKFN